MLKGGRKYSKIGIAMGMKIGDYAAKSGKNTHLLVIINARLLQKIGLRNLMNKT